MKESAFRSIGFVGRVYRYRDHKARTGIHSEKPIRTRPRNINQVLNCESFCSATGLDHTFFIFDGSCFCVWFVLILFSLHSPNVLLSTPLSSSPPLLPSQCHERPIELPTVKGHIRYREDETCPPPFSPRLSKEMYGPDCCDSKDANDV